MVASRLKKKSKRTTPKFLGIKNFTRGHFSGANLAIFALIFAVVGAYVVLKSFAATPDSCDQTFNSVASLQTAVSASSSTGQTICLSPGTYGNVSLSGTHSSNVTVTADPSLDPNGSGKVTIGSLNVSGTFIKVSNFYITAGVRGGSGSGNVTIEHNDVSNPSGYGINFSVSSNYTITGNRIHTTNTSGEGDALRFDQVNNLTISYNEITNIIECPTSSCHTDCFQTYNAGVTTNNIVFDHNYMHDNQCQGPPFLKDGDINPNVTITDNLDVRNSGGSFGTLAIAENTSNLIIRNNTYVNTTGSYIQTGGSSANPTAHLDHNVFDQIAVTGGYGLSEDYNIYTGNNQWSFGIGPHSSLNSNPGFTNTAVDDYRLASNPNGIGVDWKPSDYVYGPTNGSVSPTPPPPPPPASDTTAPTVSVSAPAAGTTVSGSSVTVSANASDNVGVTGVQFKLDGSNIGSEDTSSPYSITWNSTSATNGSHTLTAVAKDAAGNSTTSSAVNVTVNNAQSSCSGSSATICEDFASSAANFTATGGTWGVSGGKYNLTSPVDQTNIGMDNRAIHNTAISGDFNLTAEASVVGNNTSTFDDFGIIWGYQDANNYYMANFSEGDDSAANGIFKIVAGAQTKLANFPSTISSDATYSLKVVKSGSTYQVYRNNTLLASTTDSTFASGKVGLGSRNDSAIFDNLVVTTSASTPKTGDINNDGNVDIFDLSILLSNYNTSTASCDLNTDNTVNIFDLSILLSNYGT